MPIPEKNEAKYIKYMKQFISYFLIVFDKQQLNKQLLITYIRLLNDCLKNTISSIYCIDTCDL